jgi:hypothetical protein
MGGVVCAVILNGNVWSGRIYVFSYSYSLFNNNFYKSGAVDTLIDERELTRSEFEDVTGLVVVERKTLTDEKIKELGLDGIVPSAETLRGSKPYGITRFYCVLLDGDGKCLYQGVDMAAFIAALRESGF